MGHVGGVRSEKILDPAASFSNSAPGEGVWRMFVHFKIISQCVHLGRGITLVVGGIDFVDDSKIRIDIGH